ncbi:MAG TPA: PAS domain S-box protein [Candidatus Acidoferrum sp.]|nr:PAS domain S-box protein [Candidatus Acidoferrum sp.]
MTEEQFQLMVENCADILTIREADGRIRYTNASYERILGYSVEEAVGETGYELIHPEDSSKVMAALEEFLKMPGARDCMQYRARHANGSWVVLEVVAHNLLEHRGVRGLLLSGRDISERRSEEAAKEQQIVELEQALSSAKALTGVLPICSSCKKIRDDGGKWQPIEVYIRDRAPVEFSHGMCPECVVLWFPEEAEG